MAEKDSNNHIYENISRIDNVTVIDNRIIRIINRVHEAPRLIQTETEKFVSYIDSLKKSYITSIIKRKKAEQRYEEATLNSELFHREFDEFQNDSNYLVQVAHEFEHAVKRLEQIEVELILAKTILDTSIREFVIQREQLCLFSKKAEHRFVGFLHKTADKCWANMYMNNELDRLGDEDFSNPQFIYQDDTTDEDEMEHNRPPPDEFEWDGTFDDHFTETFQRQKEEGNYFYENKEMDTFYEENNKKVDDEYTHQLRPYTSESLYDDLLLYRRRCRLVRNMKPKRLIRYFKSIVHGPWEGWEEL